MRVFQTNNNIYLGCYVAICPSEHILLNALMDYVRLNGVVGLFLAIQMHTTRVHNQQIDNYFAVAFSELYPLLSVATCCKGPSSSHVLTSCISLYSSFGASQMHVESYMLPHSRLMSFPRFISSGNRSYGECTRQNCTSGIPFTTAFRASEHSRSMVYI